MSQIFSRRAGLYAKLFLLAALSVVVVVSLSLRALTAEPNAVGEAVEQPVPFSHRHHVGELGIDCRYCHSSVESDASAGIPPISTCMTCHSQLFTNQEALAPIVHAWQAHAAFSWRRVYDLPDFVYFDHSIHIAKGIACANCHGHVERMPLTARAASLSMQWCLDCHRRHDNGTHRLTDCSVCHR